jgi:uncharacterized protein YabN with tetrapyrrole methylase and pyrophosphatase domain
LTTNEPSSNATGRVADASKRGSLVVVGTGIRLVGHTSLEALACIQRAEKLFYLVTESVTESWIKRLNPSATTLADCYVAGKSRFTTYREMSDRMVSAVRAGQDVCTAVYGHPGVFVYCTHHAIRRARREGFSARMLPAISAEDCLFADLGVDPSDHGCQSFEATDFLLYRRRFDFTCSLILWQVGMLGEPSVRTNMTCRPERLRVLVSALRRAYPPRHPVVLYEAAQFPICDPKIIRLPLAKLASSTVSPLMTLYIPPLRERAEDSRIRRWLDQS